MSFGFQCLVIATSVLAVIISAWLIRGAQTALLASSGWASALSRGAQERTGMRTATLITGAALTVMAPTLYGLGGVTRAAVGFLGLLLVPGAAVILFVRLRDPLTELALSVAVSMALIVLGSQLLLAMHLWEPLAAFQVVLLVAAPLLSWHACMTFGFWSTGTATPARDLGQGSHARA